MKGELGITILGLDTVSVVDINMDRLIQIRAILLVKCLCNLDQLLYRQLYVRLFPMKMAAAGVSSIRVLAECR
jgi:kynurenine formamidase